MSPTHPTLLSVSRRLVLTSAAALALLGAHTAAQAQTKLPVTASFSILGDLVRVVGGERVAVTTLVGPDADAHAFEPKPSDAKTLLASKLLVVNGLGFEPWANRLAKSAGYKGPTVVASSGIKPLAMAPADAHAKGHGHSHGHQDVDPHAWQNPNHVVAYVNNIAAALAQADPAGAATFLANAAAYTKELQALDAWAKAQFAAIAPPKRKVITSHDAFGYFAAHYGVVFLAPQGVNTESEATAKGVAQLVRQINQENIKALFVENISDPRLIAQIGRDTGIKPAGALFSDALSDSKGPASTYLTMMRTNTSALARAMNGQ